MKKSIFMLDSLFFQNVVYCIQQVTVKSQNDIDEQRNVKQPPLLQVTLNLVNKFYIPLLNCHN
ncbi:hypothetical protein SCB49_06432 [unidentified eubacterium SCB49]|nr:hypothetical protein SCB49_06432 [unidentified eubacterium SCB49]